MDSAGETDKAESGVPRSASVLDLVGQLDRSIGRLEVFKSSLGDGSKLADDCFVSGDVQALVTVRKLISVVMLYL
jgi:hypothetical protein